MSRKQRQPKKLWKEDQNDKVDNGTQLGRPMAVSIASTQNGGGMEAWTKSIQPNVDVYLLIGHYETIYVNTKKTWWKMPWEDK